MIDNKNSLLVSHQLPEFVRDNPDYANFALFVKAYYEWMELSNAANNQSTIVGSTGQGVLHATKNLLNYSDVDTTIDEFLDYYLNTFLPYFPKETLVSKEQTLKIAKELYETKGTPASYQFLFRTLYNSDFDMFYTKDAVLKSSDGQWYIAKSLKVLVDDNNTAGLVNLLYANNLRIFGETSKSIATIETTTRIGNKIEVFISNMERTFQSGEYIRVVDNNNQELYFKDGNIVPVGTIGALTLRAKIVGQISSVNIDPKYRGNYYSSGDPVVVYGGLNSNTGIGATAVVNETRTGSIQRINVLSGGYGYSSFPNTQITFSGGQGSGAKAIVGTLNPVGVANVALIPTDTISLKKNIRIGATDYGFANAALHSYSANANTKLIDALTFTGFTTYPISSVLVTNSGGGYRTKPTTIALPGYESDLSFYDGTSNIALMPTLDSLGILGPIQITNGGEGYQNNDVIVFNGGTGQGAFANVTVDDNGTITKAFYVDDTLRRFPLGGMGYKNTDLPSLSVLSANTEASNASLYVPGILGTGASLDPITDNAGEIVSIKLIDYGEDYISTPNVSLKVQDILVSNVYSDNLPLKGDVIYQGANINVTTYMATVNNITQISFNANTQQSIWNLRVFNYNTVPDTQKELTIDNKNMHYTMSNTNYQGLYNSQGVKSYGDGSAKATAKYLNGLVIAEGRYLNSQGQPSSFNVLQNNDYNNFTYMITVEKEISKYRDILLNLLHPSGTKLIGRYALKSSNNLTFNASTAYLKGYSLNKYTGTSTYISIESDFTNKSNNIVKFNNLVGGTLLTDFLVENESKFLINKNNGEALSAKILSINDAAGTVTIDSNVWCTFGNVAYVTATSGSNVINITSLTGQYDYVNNKEYSNTMYPLMDIVKAGDNISISNNDTLTVKSVDYFSNSGKIYVTTNVTTDANSLMSVNRTFIANTNVYYDEVKIIGPIGLQYANPNLTTEGGDVIITEDGNTLIVG